MNVRKYKSSPFYFFHYLKHFRDQINRSMVDGKNFYRYDKTDNGVLYIYEFIKILIKNEKKRERERI